MASPRIDSLSEPTSHGNLAPPSYENYFVGDWKEVWNLSDQDNDSMLSLRELCIALYLMESFREGRPLPAVLPNNIMFDENHMPTAGQPTVAYGNAAWGPGPGLQQQQQQGMPGARQMMPAVGSRSQQMQLPPTHPQTDRGLQQPNQQKSRVPVLEKRVVNKLSNEEQNSLNSKFEEATEADKKVLPGTVLKLPSPILDPSLIRINSRPTWLAQRSCL